MIDKNTGRSLQTEQQSIQQSLQDIITTPIGSQSCDASTVRLFLN